MNLRKYSINLIVIIVLVLIAISLYSCWSKDFSKVFSLSLIVVISSFSVGGALGFIFGIPSYKNDNTLKKHSYERNNSLKEIADWVTKIIVGITLVEIKEIIKFFLFISNDLGSQLTNDSDEGSLYVGSIILSFFIIGFISIYLFTITDLFRYLVKNSARINNLLGDSVEVNEELRLINVNKNSKLDDYQKTFILEYVRKNNTKIMDLYQSKKLASVLFKMEEYSKSVQFFEKSSKLDPSDINLKINIAFIQSKYLNQSEKSNKLLQSLIDKHPNNAILYYNLACNYNRELIGLKDIDNKYKKTLTQDIPKFLGKAFELDKGLLSDALKDKELENIDILDIFNQIFGN